MKYAIAIGIWLTIIFGFPQVVIFAAWMIDVPVDVGQRGWLVFCAMVLGAIPAVLTAADGS